MTKRIIFFILIFLFIIFLVFLNYKGLLSGVKNLIFKILYKISTFFKDIFEGIVNSIKLVFQIRTLQEENYNLKSENLVLVSRLINDEKLLSSYSALEKQFQLSNLSDRNEYVLADVVGVSSQGVGEFLIINRGKSDGVAPGMPVVSGNVLVGKILEVYSNYSKVVLIDDSSVKVAVKTQNSQSFGVTVSEDGQIYIDLVLKDQNVAEGDVVLSSGKDGVFPPNLILGKVEKIYDSDTQLFQKIKVDPAINYYQEDSVLVISNYMK